MTMNDKVPADISSRLFHRSAVLIIGGRDVGKYRSILVHEGQGGDREGKTCWSEGDG